MKKKSGKLLRIHALVFASAFLYGELQNILCELKWNNF